MNISKDGIAPNSGRLLWAGSMAILAAGIGFGVRGGILSDWGRDFGYVAQQLGAIAGAGLTGFCFGIIIGGMVCDRLGYGKLIAAAFLTHILSACVTLAADPSQGDLAFKLLYWGTFIFAFANGTLEAVSNPLVATLFPNRRTHYLNILHASWPLGLVLGGAIGWMLGSGDDAWPWQAQLGLFLVPTLIYGWMFFGQSMPKSEAAEKGLSLGEMFKDVGLLGGLVVCFLLTLFFSGPLGLSPMSSYAMAGVLLLGVGTLTSFSMGSFVLFILFVAHALVGSVELGTDTWVQNITGNILTVEQGKILLIFTSAIMFCLRFCAGFIEEKLGLSPVGILLTCAVLAAVGLNRASEIETFYGAMVALAIYAVGKTFFWPTMLAVASDRFPRTGAIAISIMGGIGMLAGGLVGSEGLGYAKDRFSADALERENSAVYAEYRAGGEPSQFLTFKAVHGLDGAKLGAIQSRPLDERSPAERQVHEASIEGDRRTLVADSFIPLAMAVLYLLLLLHFRRTGGYRRVTLEDGIHA